jgi:uncharacterized tellurite resistance protein B-like protein
MGLFDKFTGNDLKLNPEIAFTASLLYMMAADGELDIEEQGMLIMILGRNKFAGKGTPSKELFESSIKYIRKNSLDSFLVESYALLNEQQKTCILLNMIDASFADGEAEAEEQQLFTKFINAWSLSEATIKPMVETISLKANKTIFLK